MEVPVFEAASIAAGGLVRLAGRSGGPIFESCLARRDDERVLIILTERGKGYPLMSERSGPPARAKRLRWGDALRNVDNSIRSLPEDREICGRVFLAVIFTNVFLLSNSWSARRVRNMYGSVSQKPGAWCVVVEFHRETFWAFNILFPLSSGTLPLHLPSPKIDTGGTAPTGVKDEWCWWFSSDTAFPRLRFPEPSATRLRLLEDEVPFGNRSANERSRG